MNFLQKADRLFSLAVTFTLSVMGIVWAVRGDIDLSLLALLILYVREILQRLETP